MISKQEQSRPFLHIESLKKGEGRGILILKMSFFGYFNLTIEYGYMN